jgi:hypothetical protein
MKVNNIIIKNNLNNFCLNSSQNKPIHEILQSYNNTQQLKTTDYDSDFNFNTQIIKNNKAFIDNSKRIDLKKKINLNTISYKYY